MYGPTDAVEMFYSAVNGSSVFNDVQGYYQFPCESVPTVAFNWGGMNWNLSEAKSVRSLFDKFYLADSFL